MTKSTKQFVTGDVSGLPVDRGYAWVVAFSGMFCTTIALGLLRTYGVLFVEFLRMFQMSAGMTAVILAAQAGVNSVTALLTQTVVLSFLSVRQTVVIGGFLGGLGFVLSCFAQNIYMLFFSFSLLIGISLSTITGPTLFIVGTYFDKRRSLASAIATLGVSLGSVIMPPYAQALISAFGGRGALLVLGATYLNVMVGGMLLRPLHLNKRQRDNVPDELGPKENKPHTSLRTSVRRQYSRQRSISIRSRDSADINAIGSILSLDVMFAPQEITVEIIDEITDDEQDDGNEANDAEAVRERRFIDGTEERELTLHDSDHLPESQSGVLQKESKEPTVLRKLLSFFHFGLFKRPPFLAIVASCSLGVIPVLLYGTYLPALAADKGLSDEEAATLLSIFGVTSFVSRLFFGFFADLNIIPRVLLMSLLMLLTSVTGLFTPLYNTYPQLAVFSALYGLFAPVFFAISPVLVVDLLGLENLGKTLGFMSLFQGISAAVVHPIIGHMRDVTGSYHASFFFMAICGLCSAGTLALLKSASSLKQRCQRSPTPAEEEGQADDVSEPLRNST